jgi:hypothetical protein
VQHVRRGTLGGELSEHSAFAGFGHIQRCNTCFSSTLCGPRKYPQVLRRLQRRS